MFADYYILYAVLTVILIVSMLIYFKLAVRYKIIDRPNERSSHVTPTIRGGGIIFPIAVGFFAFYSGFQYPYLITAVLLTGIISFVDDIRDLPRLIRFSVHILAAVLVLFQAGVFTLPIVLIVLAFILVVGMFNAYNFMDGINGITGFYSLAIVIPLMVTEEDSFNLQLQYFALIALLIFLFFNARKKARCFAGDVGSITIAVIMCFLVVQRIVDTDDYTYLGFFALYLVDTGLTIIQRATAGEKVLDAHRRHLFQVLSNENSWPHLAVALLYALIQFGINYFFINTNMGIPGLIVVFVTLIAIYILVKYIILKVPFGRPVATEQRQD